VYVCLGGRCQRRTSERFELYAEYKPADFVKITAARQLPRLAQSLSPLYTPPLWKRRVRVDDEFMDWVVVNEVNSVVVVLLDLVGQTKFDIDTGQLTHVPSLPVKSPTESVPK